VRGVVTLEGGRAAGLDVDREASRAHDFHARGSEDGRVHVVVAAVVEVVEGIPERVVAVEGASEALLKRRSGKAAFTFPALDDETAEDLERLATAAATAMSVAPLRTAPEVATVLPVAVVVVIVCPLQR